MTARLASTGTCGGCVLCCVVLVVCIGTCKNEWVQVGLWIRGTQVDASGFKWFLFTFTLALLFACLTYPRLFRSHLFQSHLVQSHFFQFRSHSCLPVLSAPFFSFSVSLVDMLPLYSLPPFPSSLPPFMRHSLHTHRDGHRMKRLHSTSVTVEDSVS